MPNIYDHIVSRAVPMSRWCGVYFLIDQLEIVYIGQSRNIPARVQHHAAKGIVFDSVSVVSVAEGDLNEWESFYIHYFNPKHNKGDHNNGRQHKHAPMKLDALVRLWAGRLRAHHPGLH
jgi:hypothetical protein